MNTDTSHFKSLLNAEKERIENELKGMTQPAGGGSVDAIQKETNEDAGDREDVAEAIESYENNESAVVTLRTALNEVNKALEKIEAGTFGTCETCGASIENDRLEAYPAARTCTAHTGDL